MRGKRKTEQDYRDLAKKRGFEWLGQLPKNTEQKTWWRCPEGHEWEARYHNIRRGSGCPYCSGLARKTEQDYRDTAKRRGFEWIGEVLPENVFEKTWWRCPKGHEWEADYHNIRKGRGCPLCLDFVNGQRVTKPQRKLHELLGGVLNYPFGKRRIDVALPDKKIAVEYDGWFDHGDLVEEDAQRDEELIAAGWKVLHVRSGVKVPTKARLDEAIARLDNGETVVEIVLDDWGKRLTRAEVRAMMKVDPWEKGPIPISFDGGLTEVEAEQLVMWTGQDGTGRGAVGQAEAGHGGTRQG